jgi:hypothetical protein
MALLRVNSGECAGGQMWAVTCRWIDSTAKIIGTYLQNDHKCYYTIQSESEVK